MTPTKEITAQDFIDCMVVNYTASPMLATRETIKAFDELISQVRHEAIAEWESVNLNKKIQQAFSAGRIQGLKEMDEAHGKCDIALDVKDKEGFDEGMKVVSTLRSEYRQE